MPKSRFVNINLHVTLRLSVFKCDHRTCAVFLFSSVAPLMKTLVETRKKLVVSKKSCTSRILKRQYGNGKVASYRWCLYSRRNFPTVWSFGLRRLAVPKSNVKTVYESI